MERSPKHPLEISHTYPCCKEPRDGACHACHVTQSRLDTPSSLKVHFQIELGLFIQCNKKKTQKLKHRSSTFQKPPEQFFFFAQRIGWKCCSPPARLTSQSRRPPLRSQQSSDSEPALLQRTTSPRHNFNAELFITKLMQRKTNICFHSCGATQTRRRDVNPRSVVFSLFGFFLQSQSGDGAATFRAGRKMLSVTLWQDGRARSQR